MTLTIAFLATWLAMLVHKRARSRDRRQPLDESVARTTLVVAAPPPPETQSTPGLLSALAAPTLRQVREAAGATGYPDTPEGLARFTLLVTMMHRHRIKTGARYDLAAEPWTTPDGEPGFHARPALLDPGTATQDVEWSTEGLGVRVYARTSSSDAGPLDFLGQANAWAASLWPVLLPAGEAPPEARAVRLLDPPITEAAEA